MPVQNRNGVLYLSFTCMAPDGARLRCRESTRLKDTPANRKAIEVKERAIKYHLKDGSFKYLDFFPHGVHAARFDRKTTMTLAEWWEQWMSEKSLAWNTERNAVSVWKVHLGPRFGHMRLDQITESEILLFRKHLQTKDLTAHTINERIVKRLCLCLRKAHRRGLIPSYPCEDIVKLKGHAKDIRPYSYEELHHFLSVLKQKDPEAHDLVVVWTRTGLRPGEMCALKWTQVDYFNCKLLIRQSMTDRLELGDVKTQSSSRDVDLRPDVVEALKRQEARTKLKGEYIWQRPNGLPYYPKMISDRFRGLCKLAGLPYRSCGQFRHTFATLHLAAGERVKWVSKMLGHTTSTMTLKHYDRWIPNLTTDDGSAFERVFDTQNGTNVAHKPTSNRNH